MVLTIDNTKSIMDYKKGQDMTRVQVNGDSTPQKCKIDSDEYKNLLSYYREQAKQIHGDNIVLWKEKQYWRRLEKQRSMYRKRRNMNEYIDRQTAIRINNYEIGGCPF